MKTIKTISKFAMVAFIAIATSCSKDDQDAPVIPVIPQQASDSFITASVSGSEFSSFIFGQSVGIATMADGVIIMNSGDLAGQSISFALYGVTGPGTYTVNPDSESFIQYSPNANSATTKLYTTSSCDSSGGTIVVTILDAVHVEGTFTFTAGEIDDCGDTKIITEGKFKGTFQ